jgi:hypothetical protein
MLSNEEKTNDYEHFEKGMIYMKILKRGVVEKRGEEETKSMSHAPVVYPSAIIYCLTSTELYFCYLHDSNTFANNK